MASSISRDRLNKVGGCSYPSFQVLEASLSYNRAAGVANGCPRWKFIPEKGKSIYSWYPYNPEKGANHHNSSARKKLTAPAYVYKG
jgi:hypothetical protein